MSPSPISIPRRTCVMLMYNETPLWYLNSTGNRGLWIYSTEVFHIIRKNTLLAKWNVKSVPFRMSVTTGERCHSGTETFDVRELSL